MFVLCAEKNRLTVREREALTSGSVNAYPLRIEFSPEWDGLERAVIFQAGGVEKSLALSGGACTIPAEVLSEPGRYLMAGVCGSRGGDVILPTVWGNLGLILEGAAPSTPPDPIPGGAADHRTLTNRGAAEQHPITAISGLEEALERIPEPAEALKNYDLEEILK